MSSIFLIPPPTVKGTNTLSAAFSIVSIIIPLFSFDAVISKNVISSAPSSLYFLAISTGSPASIKFSKLTPFTTRPLSISRHGIIRLANIFVNLNTLF